MQRSSGTTTTTTAAAAFGFPSLTASSTLTTTSGGSGGGGGGGAQRRPGNIIRPPTENERASFSALPSISLSTSSALPSLGISLSTVSSFPSSSSSSSPSSALSSSRPKATLPPTPSSASASPATSSGLPSSSSSQTNRPQRTTESATANKRQAVEAANAADLSKMTVKELMSNRKFVGRPTKATAERELARKRRRPSKTSSVDNNNNEEEEVEDNRPTLTTTQGTSGGQIFAPQLRMVDGKIVLNEESMTVSAALDAPTANDYDVVYESTNHVTSSSYANRTAPMKWSTEETDLFFQALCQCGTDFTLISKMFPNRTRKQIRHKFKREDKENPLRVSYALSHPQPLHPENYQILMSSAAEQQQQPNNNDDGDIVEEGGGFEEQKLIA